MALVTKSPKRAKALYSWDVIMENSAINDLRSTSSCTIYELCQQSTYCTYISVAAKMPKVFSD